MECLRRQAILEATKMHWLILGTTSMQRRRTWKRSLCSIGARLFDHPSTSALVLESHSIGGYGYRKRESTDHR